MGNGLHMELGPLLALVQIGGNAAGGAYGRSVQLCLAVLGAILAVVVALDGNAVLAVALRLPIGYGLIVAILAGHLHDSTLEVLLPVRFDAVGPIVTPVAVDLAHNLEDVVMVMRRGRRLVVVRKMW